MRWAAFVAAVATLFAADGASGVAAPRFINGGEFPGAKGGIAAQGDGYVLSYDFSGGGAYVEMRHEFGSEGMRLESFACRIRGPQGLRAHARFIDATGQNFIKGFRLGDGEWNDYLISVKPRWWGYGGANDGVLHLPLKSLSIGLDKTDGVPFAGELAVEGLRLHEQVGYAFVGDHAKDAPLYPVRLDGRLANGHGGESPPKTLAASVTNCSAQVIRGTFELTVRGWDGDTLAFARSDALELPPGGRVGHSFSLPEIVAARNFAEYALAFAGEDGKRVPSFPWARTWTRPVAGDVPPCAAPELPWGLGAYLYRNGNDENGRRRLAAAAALTRNMGAKWIREEFNWGRIEPERGRLELDFYDYMVDTAISNGFTIAGMFAYWTKWTKPYTEEGFADYLRTLSLLVNRYRGKVDRWEIWNEPDIPFWKGPKEDYYKLLARAWATVKAANPDAEVWGFSTSGISRGFIEKGLAAKARFDRISVHPYTGFLREREFMADISWVWEKAGGRSVPLTELGWSTWRQGTSERDQATWLARAAMSAAATRKALAFVPYWLFDGHNFDHSEHNYGIVRPDGATKPAYRALAQVYRTFRQGEPSLAFTPLGNGIEAIIFAMGGTSVVWTDYEMPVAVSVRAADGISAVNLMGEAVALERAGDRVVFHCSIGRPVFFNGLAGRPEFVSSPVPIKRIIAF